MKIKIRTNTQAQYFNTSHKIFNQLCNLTIYVMGFFLFLLSVYVIHSVNIFLSRKDLLLFLFRLEMKNKERNPNGTKAIKHLYIIKIKINYKANTTF